MKSITINGLTFTDAPPTKEGWWLWATSGINGSVMVESIRVGGGLALVFGQGSAGTSCTELNGFWHELVPRQTMAEEVEKAYWEGREGDEYSAKWAWEHSRAKRIAEGKEV